MSDRKTVTRRHVLHAGAALSLVSSRRPRAGHAEAHPLRASRADRARLAHLGRAVQESRRAGVGRQAHGADLSQRADGQRARHRAGGAPGLARDGRDRRRPHELGARDVDHRRPFLWKSRQQCWNAINGAFGDDLRKRSLEKGFVLSGWTDLGFRSITNNKLPINSAKDMQGLKMRVPTPRRTSR
jgi:hypothetical protein